MPSTRRRLLLGAAGTIAALAGCNESTSGGPRSTVTPVDVPKTKAEALAEAAEIEWPEIPSSVRVTDDHLAAATADAERLVSDLQSTIEDGEEVDLSGLNRPAPTTPEEIIERAESQLEAARENGPSREALSTVQRAIREVALALGYIEAKRGDLDREGLEAAVDEEQAATEALVDRFSYRVADPLAEYLPTLQAAEVMLGDVRTIDNLRKALAEADSDHADEETAYAVVRREIASHRRNRKDAARLLATATDERRPSVRSAIEVALSGVRSEVEAIADTYADRDPPNGASVEGEIRNIRFHVGHRSQRWLSELEDHDGEQPLRLLLDVAAWLVEFESLDTAVARTVGAMDDEEIPGDAIVSAKRDAVDALRAAAEGSALQRELAARSSILIRSADRNADRNEDARTVARTHLLYAAADEWGTRALERADAVAAALQAQQS